MPPDVSINIWKSLRGTGVLAAFTKQYRMRRLAAKARGQGFMSFVLAEMKLRRVLIGVLTTSNASDTEIAIRQNVLDAIGAKAAVFDAFAGSGDMCSAVWKKAGTYVGCDLKPQTDSRLMFCADNARVLRAIDLSRFSIFDFEPMARPESRPSSWPIGDVWRLARPSAWC
jgi:hypothetical protein